MCDQSLQKGRFPGRYSAQATALEAMMPGAPIEVEFAISNLIVKNFEATSYFCWLDMT